jgi:hypothetical protein
MNDLNAVSSRAMNHSARRGCEYAGFLAEPRLPRDPQINEETDKSHCSTQSDLTIFTLLSITREKKVQSDHDDV